MFTTIIKQGTLLPVLEPLSKATEQTLRPINLGKHDFLTIDIDDDGKKFITQTTSFKESDEDNSEPIEINGRKMFRRFEGATYTASNGWQHRIPERKNLGWGKYAFAATDFSVLVIHHVWPADRLVFENEDAEDTYKFLLLRFLSQSNSQRVVANFKANGHTPKMPEDFIEHPELPLTEYQKVALLSCLSQQSSGLLMEQGTGKTPIVIARICLESRRKTEGMYRALIVCPNQVRANWENEFSRFATRPGKTSVMRGDVVSRTRSLVDGVRDEKDCEWSACIISTDSVASTWRAIKRIPWDLVVLDESHYIKDPRAKRSKVMRQFSETSARQKMALTGTPIGNSVMDLWSQFEFLGEGLSGFMTFQNFKGFHGKFETQGAPGATSVQKLVCIKALPLIQERLSRLCFMITKRECNLGLPDKVYDLEEVDMTPDQERLYNTLAERMIAQIDEILADDSKTVTADHILTMLLRLAQITSGHVRWDGKEDPDTGKKLPGIVEQIQGGNPKIDAVVKMLKDTERDERSKTIVWSCWVEDIRALSQRLHDEEIEHVGYHAVTHKDHRISPTDSAVEHFNNTATCQVFLANPASSGVGANIVGYDINNPDDSDTFTGHEIFMSCNWSALQRSQAEDRAHRRGTRGNVRITDLMVPGTIDEEIRARLMAKKQTAMLIQDVREILRNIVGKLEGV